MDLFGIVQFSSFQGCPSPDDALTPKLRAVLCFRPISFQCIPILIDGHDTQGLLALLDGQLVAVLSRLDGDIHDADLKGRWHLEAGFGPCDG